MYKLRYLSAILLTTSLVSAKFCPSEDIIAPCKCNEYFRTIECDKLDGNTDLPAIFQRLANDLSNTKARPFYETFTLSNSGVKQLGTTDGVDLFAGLYFRRINLVRNVKLSRIHPGALRSCYNETEHLSFEDNTVLGAAEQDNVDLFAEVNRFRSLKTFHLTDSGIRAVPDKAFKAPQPELYEILMTDNRIEKIGDNAFTGLEALGLLNLDGNQISKLSLRSFEMHSTPRNSEKLVKIFLRSNRLSSSSFPPGIFSYLRRRAFLNLNLNNLTSVPQEVFQSFFLRKGFLSLYKNPLKCDCKFKWLYDQRLLYNSSDTKSEYFLREYQCTSDLDEDQLIHEATASDFEHCKNPEGDNEANQATANHKHCIEANLDPESEHWCINGAVRSAVTNSVLLAHVILLVLFRYVIEW